MQNTDIAARPISRRVARELAPEELMEVSGGDGPNDPNQSPYYCTVTASGCQPVTDSNGEQSDQTVIMTYTYPDGHP
jgi:hypothetical protein